MALLLVWRPLAAWWGDANGNRALLRGQSHRALAWFDWSLRLEPSWALLHEDRGRALLESDPAAALSEFDRAGCGAPCDAEAGDALVHSGKMHQAVERYIKARAVSRVSQIALQLTRENQYDAALLLMHDLIGRLHNGFLERADLATSYATLGAIQVAAAAANPAQARQLRSAAIESFATASRLAPYNEGFLLSYAFAQAQWGQPAAARRAFLRLLQLHPHQPDAEAALARTARAKTRTAQPHPQR